MRPYEELGLEVVNQAIADLKNPNYRPAGKAEFCPKCFLTTTIHNPKNIWGQIIAKYVNLGTLRKFALAQGEHVCNLPPTYKTKFIAHVLRKREERRVQKQTAEISGAPSEIGPMPPLSTKSYSREESLSEAFGDSYSGKSSFTAEISQRQ